MNAAHGRPGEAGSGSKKSEEWLSENSRRARNSPPVGLHEKSLELRFADDEARALFLDGRGSFYLKIMPVLLFEKIEDAEEAGGNRFVKNFRIGGLQLLLDMFGDLRRRVGLSRFRYSEFSHVATLLLQSDVPSDRRRRGRANYLRETFSNAFVTSMRQGSLGLRNDAGGGIEV